MAVPAVYVTGREAQRVRPRVFSVFLSEFLC
jgi:hypothetical protein